MISTNHAGSGKAGSGASAHVTAGSVHTGNFTNHFFCFFVYFQDALDGGCILQRVYVDDVGMGIGNMLLHLGAVFDGTGSFAQIRGNVVAQNFLGQTQIVAVDPGLVYLRQERGVSFFSCREECRRRVARTFLLLSVDLALLH